MKCTWKECFAEATKPQIATDGEQWANLCDEHHQELETAIDVMIPKILLRAWTLAMGGAKRATKRVHG